MDSGSIERDVALADNFGAVRPWDKSTMSHCLFFSAQGPLDKEGPETRDTQPSRAAQSSALNAKTVIRYRTVGRSPVSRVSGPVCLLVCVVGSGGGMEVISSTLARKSIIGLRNARTRP